MQGVALAIDTVRDIQVWSVQALGIALADAVGIATAA
jgi:hypothetical protein